MSSKPKSKHCKSGFTLLELLVVISIIAILMGMIVPVFSTMRENARVAKARAGAKNLETAFRAYLDENKTWAGMTPGEIKDGTFDNIKTFYEFDSISIDEEKAVNPWYDPGDPNTHDQVYHVRFDNYNNQISDPDNPGVTIHRPVVVWTKNPSDRRITSWD